ncbi:MerR family transcriptional regulator, partial [Ferroacidibacillus organovorans]
MAEKERWKVGELAKLTGITIRALHHYDQIGLLVPFLHSGAGHRLYSGKDIARLQQIISLKLIFDSAPVTARVRRPYFALQHKKPRS